MNYVTHPILWEIFYKDMASNKFNPYTYRRLKKRKRTGRGLHGRYRNSYRIPVNPNAIDVDTNSIESTMISPVAAADERANSEMKVVRKK